MSRRRRVIESEEEDDSNTEVSSSPRRSRRLSRQSADFSQSADEDESDDNAHNLNRNRNQNHNHLDGFEAESSDDDIKEDDEPEEIPETHPTPSHFLPTPISKLPSRYQKIAADIQDVALPRLIDIATDISEYNTGDNYPQLAQRLQDTMDSLLSLSKHYQLESLMLSQMHEQIASGEIDDNKVDDCPIVSGDWTAFLNTKRDEIHAKIESENALDTTQKRVQQKIKRLQAEYEQQFKDAIQRDDIEDPDDMDTNHNNRNSDDESSDEDIIVEKSSVVGSIKCPFTQKVFEKPVKSKDCGHTFEKEAILEYVQAKSRRGERVNCPLPGCSKYLTADGFVRDVKIEKLIRAQKKQKEQQESDEDDALFDFTVAND